MLSNVNGLALTVSAAVAVLAAVASPARAQQTAWFLGDGGQDCSAVCEAQGRECSDQTLTATIERTGNDQSLGEAFAAAGYTCPAYDNGCGNYHPYIHPNNACERHTSCGAGHPVPTCDAGHDAYRRLCLCAVPAPPPPIRCASHTGWGDGFLVGVDQAGCETAASGLMALDGVSGSVTCTSDLNDDQPGRFLFFGDATGCAEYRSAVAAIVGGTVACDGWGNRHLRLQPECDAARLLSLNAAATPSPTTVAPATAAPTASPTAGCCEVVSVSGHTNPAWNGRYTMQSETESTGGHPVYHMLGNSNWNLVYRAATRTWLLDNNHQQTDFASSGGVSPACQEGSACACPETANLNRAAWSNGAAVAITCYRATTSPTAVPPTCDCTYDVCMEGCSEITQFGHDRFNFPCANPCAHICNPDAVVTAMCGSTSAGSDSPAHHGHHNCELYCHNVTEGRPLPTITPSPTTSVPTTAVPSTRSPTTAAPATSAPSTAGPSTAMPTTGTPATTEPTTSLPTSFAPTSAPSASPTVGASGNAASSTSVDGSTDGTIVTVLAAVIVLLAIIIGGMYYREHRASVGGGDGTPSGGVNATRRHHRADAIIQNQVYMAASPPATTFAEFTSPGLEPAAATTGYMEVPAGKQPMTQPMVLVNAYDDDGLEASL